MLSAAEAWLSEAVPVKVSQCASRLPHSSGLYAFYLTGKAKLHPAFQARLAACGHPTRLYIGKASQNLHKRVWEQECQHKRPGTFFRSVGVMLGYVSPTGGKNFCFSAAESRSTIEWINANLSVAWLAMNAADLKAIEQHLIERHRPLLNIQDNPDKFALLSRLRAWSQYLDRRVGRHPLDAA